MSSVYFNLLAGEFHCYVPSSQWRSTLFNTRQSFLGNAWHYL